MATVTHTIYLRYDPADREKLEKETGQATEADESEDWALKSSFLRRAKPPPRFVPATIAYEDFTLAGSMGLTPHDTKQPPSGGTGVADWYRSLASRSSSAGPSSTSGATAPTNSSDPLSRPRTAPSSSAQPQPPSRTQPAPAKKPDKNDWFIQNVLRNPDEQLHQPAPSASSLADILARDPPPKPKEQPFKPPVFLALGPANRGWGMLQKSGWREGDTLGPNARKPSPAVPPSRKGKERASSSHIKSEPVEFALDDDGELKEMTTLWRLTILSLTSARWMSSRRSYPMTRICQMGTMAGAPS
ncbi:uncharacterized protein SCHCODRAFT_02615974 [Schizophyllum commune H4-8]|uniref:uncharacterized protein n=1 Tax=Schizophyllum commune (strain H4-8 / FGSC 9210) TaxID=578458 RepID=UPI0021609C5F|nr:uncharacterized protein SCHCODRAFT_02615974 [Schizophyllum commune H4-8]KAI5896844.1 hypothetical protein SCHCODRAFT_02615974 [Schizophyllum commune H4-8]